MIADLLIGVASGTLVLLGDRICSALFRRRRAGAFTGRYIMCDPHTGTPNSGHVTIEYNPPWGDWFLGVPTELAVIAEHGMGTEDWTAMLEVRSSDTAIGYYRYQNREGGELRFTRLPENRGITEYGIPHSGSQPFIRLLKSVLEAENE